MIAKPQIYINRKFISRELGGRSIRNPYLKSIFLTYIYAGTPNGCSGQRHGVQQNKLKICEVFFYFFLSSIGERSREIVLFLLRHIRHIIPFEQRPVRKAIHIPIHSWPHLILINQLC